MPIWNGRNTWNDISIALVRTEMETIHAADIAEVEVCEIEKTKKNS